ncbi:AAA family ATPase [Fusibacter ferrireducens]|uniref:AAA family ATPase n=1 Tax=Fusibacter ferrireducens TaxID=2785058 RepID=A0ABR9ZSV3_9FIRM|nr:ATP-binding protein [Fusibacter ferrireducens]MBF4693527.1 AAA family ATPase [Fusibacter ferrireducens]
MLKKFELRNYKNFEEPIIIDFGKVGGYQFNEDCISNQLISKMIIYGRNATGKTNLGVALRDITYNLSTVGFFRRQEGNYLNADSKEPFAEFIYTFRFGQDELIYKYRKISEVKIHDEELLLNDIRCFYYNFASKASSFENLKVLEADTIVIERFLSSMDTNEDDESVEQTLSFLRWLISNTALSANSILLKLDNYINRMAFVTVSNTMMPKIPRMYDSFTNMLADKEALIDFEDFLNIMGIECNLALELLPEGQNQLYFKHNKLVPFFENASSGTLALTNLYRRFEMGKTASLMYLDEFDAFYHYEMAEKIIQFFKHKYPNCQIILTTHNTNLMTNRLMRPDCLFILSQQGNLTSLCDATARELREGHNLEKMYISGEFERYE